MFRGCVPGRIPTAEGPWTKTASARSRSSERTCGVHAPGPVADLDDDTIVFPDELSRTAVCSFVNRRDRRKRGTAGELVEVEVLHELPLYVHGEQQIAGDRLRRVEHRVCAAPKRRGKGFRGMERICRAHHRGKLEERKLLMPRYLLHVEALVVGGFVAEKVVDAYPVRQGHDRSREGMKRAGPDRGEHGCRFPVLPA